MDNPLLDLYAGCPIASSGPTTATGYSGPLRVDLSQDKLTHFLLGDVFTSADL